ncbi:MAG TPA: hypothetical protein VHE83_19550 [Mycobacteriales bacterium]|nr:hypothetical protein [Mycobacteriales bacterium]
MRARSRLAALAAAGGAGAFAVVVAVIATVDVSSAGATTSAPTSTSRPAALPTCPPSTSAAPAADDAPVSYQSGSFAPVTAAPSYGVGLSITNHEDRPLTVSRTNAPTFSVTVPAGAVRHLALPTAVPTLLRYTGDVPAALLEPSEHALAAVVIPSSPAPPSGVTACVVATGTPSPSRSASTRPSASPSRSASHAPSRSASASHHASPSASPSTDVVVIPPGELPSEQPSLAPIQSGVKPSVAPEPSIVLPTYSAPATPAPTAAAPSTPPVVDLAQPVPARHRGLPITIGIFLIAGVGSAVARAVRGLRS